MTAPVWTASPPPLTLNARGQPVKATWIIVDDVGIRLDSLPTSRATSVPLTPVNPGQPRQPAAPHQRTSTSTTLRLPMIPKLNTRVRFPSSAPQLPAQTVLECGSALARFSPVPLPYPDLSGPRAVCERRSEI